VFKSVLHHGSNSSTVQSLQYKFNTKVISVRQTGQPCPSLRTRLAREEQKRWCPHSTNARLDQTHRAVVAFRLLRRRQKLATPTSEFKLESRIFFPAFSFVAFSCLAF